MATGEAKMAIFRRSARERSAGSIGFEAAVGIPTDDVGAARRFRDPETALDLTCSHCGTEGRIDLVDAAGRRAYLTCPQCSRTWDTDSAVDRAIRRPVAPASRAQ